MVKKELKVTPMIKQYLDIKEEYPDAILFFRVGDFYEMFFEDAEIGAKELEIVLTKRSVDKNDPNPVPLAGVPYHACENYISRLLDKGYKVAICEQVEDPQKAKGIVKREVVRLITPGTVLDSHLLKEKEHNYLAAMSFSDHEIGLAMVDVSTGDFFVTEFDQNPLDALQGELTKSLPKEIIVSESFQHHSFLQKLKNEGVLITIKDQPNYSKAYHILVDHYELESLEGFGLADHNMSIVAAGMLMDYLTTTQKNELQHLKAIRPYETESYLVMDANTRKNLELCETIRSRKKHGSLLWVLDKTLTAMGGRMLRTWVQQPLVEEDAIQERLDYVEVLLDDFAVREELIAQLTQVYDLERILGKLIYDRANAKDLIALQKSLEVVPQIRAKLKESHPIFEDMINQFPDFNDLMNLIHRAIVEDPPTSLKEGGIIKEGFDDQLDQLRHLAHGGKEWISDLEHREKERTGIRSLKVSYNKVFGYYIEVTKKNLDHVPDDYIRKQTLVNAERYVTPDLKEYEDKILRAEEQIGEREYELFQSVRSEVIHYIKEIQSCGELLAKLDALLSLSMAATEYNYMRPRVNQSTKIEIKQGRHPVVERVGLEEPFVPNDTFLDNSTEQIALITGPNMAGKSTYMRQVALIIIMAQMGSFVPAERAELGIVDRIFTRVGAADDLVGGQSTFMVEMNEVANILNNATPKSFVILDEVGRGTSTFDGISIARAVIEYLHQEDGKTCKTMFATHYHELIQLADEFSRIVNYRVSVKEEGEKMVFLREIERGGTDKSYGVQVARLAGIPRNVINRAREILAHLENRRIEDIPMSGYQVDLTELHRNSHQKSDVIDDLLELDPDDLTPREALEKLYELHHKLNGQ